MRRKTYSAGLILTVMGISVTGCGDGESNASRRLLPAEERAATVDAESQRVRNMQRVKYMRHNADGSTESMDEDIVDLKTDIYRRCSDDLPLHDSVCANGVAAYRATLCQAEALLAAAKVRATPVVVRSTDPDSVAYVEIPQQSHAVNAKMAKIALEKVISIYTDSQDHSGHITYDYRQWCEATGAETLSQNWQSGLGFGRIGDTLINVFARAYDLAEEAAYLAADEMIAVSDAERSSIHSTRTAGWRAWNQRDLSRIAAAQIIISGAFADGIWKPEIQSLAEPADFPDGFCPNKPLSAPAQRAAQIFRSAAPPVAWLMDPQVSTKSILDGDMGETPVTGNVAVRLAELYHDSTLATTSDLAGHFGLKLEDFEEARKYLVDEIKAFARDPDETMAPTAGGTYLPFAALHVARNEAPDAFYVALAVGDGNAVEARLGHVYHPTSLSYMRTTARNTSSTLAAEATTNPYGLASDQTQVLLGVAGTLNESALAANPGLFHIDVSSAGYVAYSDSSTKQYRLMLGERGLTCATKGLIEGRACTNTELEASTRGTLSDYTSGCSTGSRCVGGYFSDGLQAPRRYYLVREMAEGVSGPGRFELVAASELRKIGGNGDIPAASADYARVADIMRPSKEWCNHPRKSCSGASFDERLPLEDELTNDSDGVESSWKHYLALAKQAAEEADALGSAYVTAGLELDGNISETSIREEQKRQQLNSIFETIQNTCGTSVDVQRILDLLIGKPGGSCTSSGDCKGTGLVCSNGTCETGYRTCSTDADCNNGTCTNGICIPTFRNIATDANLENDRDVQRLAKCISEDVYDFVGIGDGELCVTGISGNAYCSNGSSASNPCPRVITSTTACDGAGESHVKSDPDGTGTTHSLGMFHVKQAPAEDPNLVCDAIGTIRTSADAQARKDALATIQNSKVFLPDFVKNTAKRLGFEARIGAFAAVTVDSNSTFHTGSYGNPNYGQWPCAAHGSGTTPTQTGGLWAQSPVDCDDDLQRGAIGDRLMRAVILARIVGGYAFPDGIKTPAWMYDAAARPITNAYTTRLLLDATSDPPMAGAVTEVDQKFDGFPVKVYVTADQTALGMPIYVSRLNGNLVRVPIQGKFSAPGQAAVDAWFALGDYAPRGWKDDGELIVLDAKTQKVSKPLWVISTTNGTTTIQSVDAKFSANEPPLEGMIGNNGSWAETKDGATYTHVYPISGFKSLGVEQMFRDMSTAVKPPVEDSVADGWFSRQLNNLVEGRPLESLPSHVVLWSSHNGARHEGDAIPLYDPVELTGDGLLDALEVLCRGRAAITSGAKPNLNAVPDVTSPSDLTAVKAYMEEAAKSLEDWAARFVIPKFPKLAADFLRQESNSGVVPVLGGTYATAMTALRASLVELAQVSPLIASELRQLAMAVEQVRIATAKTDISAQLAELNFESQMASNAAACAGSVASMDSKLSFGASAAVACTNAIVQGIIAGKQLELNTGNAELDKAASLNSFQEQLNTHAQALQSYSARVSKALEEIDGTIAELERQRLAARRAFADTVRLASFTPAAADNIAAALVRQRETARVRYKSAFENAKRMSFLAKRSIEQRLGILMADMADDLPLVDAPNKWEGTVCDRTGIDYQKVRATNKDAPTNYADAFIGEYVSKLERVVESYRLENSFHEGVDTAVISMREDVLNVKAPCEVPSKNFLMHSADLDTPAVVDGTFGWRATGCASRTDAQGKPLPPQNCVSAVPTNAKASIENEPFGSTRVYKLFGGKATRQPCAANECDYVATTPSSAWSQHVRLSEGVYRFSYFAPACTTNCSQSTVTASIVDSGTGSEVALDWNNWKTSLGDQSASWIHRFAIFRLTQPLELEVQFRPGDLSVTGNPGVFAAPMVEKIAPKPGDEDYLLFPPHVITTSNDSNTVSMNNCEDKDGAIFRATTWSMGELPLCPDGFAGSCSPDKVTHHKYWQIPFSIYQRDIEAGRILKKAGFARGNFNYRIESVALNFVGTGVRNCETSDSPSTCYSAGFVPYSLDHIGPYTVRNHFGGDFEAKLFTGHVEHARGLAAERYITNPISSSDQQLLEPYVRTELQGRPLDGNFVIRLWEDPGVYFDGIQDIQVVLKYRYWTRFD